MLLVIAMVGVGSIVYVQRSAASLGGLIQDLTFDLKVRDQDECAGDGVSATWTVLDMAPGDSFAFGYPDHYVDLEKLGLLPADHLEIGCSYSGFTVPDEMARQMTLTGLSYTKGAWSIDLLRGTGGPCIRSCGYDPGDWQVQDVDGDGKLTFYDLQARPLDNLPPPCLGGGGDARVEMSMAFDEQAGDQYQGVSLTMTMYFTIRLLPSLRIVQHAANLPKGNSLVRRAMVGKSVRTR